MLHIKDFNLKHTVESGQPLTFYSHYSAEGSAERLDYVTTKGAIGVSLGPSGFSYTFEGDYTAKSAKEEATRRLSLGHDLQEIYGHIGTDEFMTTAINSFYGLRVTQNDPWEATLCFLISQFNNIKRIRLIMHNLINTFGYEFGDRRLFPTPESLASTETARIRACGTGFRDRYIKSVAEQFAHSFDPAKLYRMKYGDAKEALMELDGVGDKVADCILLFGYNKMEAFPIDVWIKRVMENVYFNGRKKSISALHEFADRKWPGYQGYAQQYIFWYGRESKVAD